MCLCVIIYVIIIFCRLLKYLIGFVGIALTNSFFVRIVFYASVNDSVTASGSASASATAEYPEGHNGATGSRMLGREAKKQDVSRYVKSFIISDISDINFDFTDIFTNLLRIKRNSSRNLEQHS